MHLLKVVRSYDNISCGEAFSALFELKETSSGSLNEKKFCSPNSMKLDRAPLMTEWEYLGILIAR